jgi:hypothetical protein
MCINIYPYVYIYYFTYILIHKMEYSSDIKEGNIAIFNNKDEFEGNYAK